MFPPNPGFSIQAHLPGGLVDPFFTWVLSSQIYLSEGFFHFPMCKKRKIKIKIWDLFAGDCCICNNNSRICLWEKWNGGAWNGSSLWVYMASGFRCRSRNQVQLLVLAPGLHTSRLIHCFWVCLIIILSWCSSFTVLQHLSIWGNLVGFYVINFLFSAIPSSGMYTIMFRLCSQPSYWITMFVSINQSHLLSSINKHLPEE